MQSLHRCRPDRGLRPAWLHLAHHENRRRTAAPTQSAGAYDDARPCRGDRNRERVDPAHASEHRDTVVFISQHHHLLAGAGACRRDDLGHDARASERDARIAVPARAPAAVPGLYWFSDQPVAEHHSTGDIDQGSGRAAGKHGLHAGRCALRHPLHPRLHRNVLLRIPRKGESRRGVSLMPAVAFKSNWLRQVTWFLALWTASVIGLAVVAMVFRAIMTAVGLTGGEVDLHRVHPRLLERVRGLRWAHREK